MTLNNKHGEPLKALKQLLRQAVTITPQRAAAFFKTGKGQYAEGEQFLGITVPTLRKIAKQHRALPLQVLAQLLASSFNEERLLALLILIHQYQAATERQQQRLYQFYLKHLKYVNNWNLVDASAHCIVGAHLWEKDRSCLLQLAASPNLWKRRVAMVATWYFIRHDDLVWTFKLAAVLKHDPEDLMHKAVGWMLREAGKRDTAPLLVFLGKHAATMPRTMLRYAIEKFPRALRQHYLNMPAQD